MTDQRAHGRASPADQGHYRTELTGGRGEEGGRGGTRHPINDIEYPNPSQDKNQNQNNFISETYNVSNIKINLLLMGANSWKPI